jgi:alpha-tubulin suppressor-like RCC1 family protein
VKNRKVPLPALISIVLVFSLILAAAVAEAASAPVSVPDDHAIINWMVPSSDAASKMTVSMSSAGLQEQAAPVVGITDNNQRCCDVGGWTNITQIDAGYRHTVGLKADGTVVAVRDNEEEDYGECNVDGWTDIIQVAAGAYHTVGLKADGTVVAVGRNENGECDVDGWTGIIEVDAGGGLAGGHTVGLKADGTAVAVGWNGFEQCNIGSWTGLVQLMAGRHYTVGLKGDGTAVAIGRNYYGQCNVGNWTDIIQIDPGSWHTVGRKADGAVVAVGCSDEGWNSKWGQCEVCDWAGIIHASAGGYHTVGLKADGTVVAVGENGDGQCNVSDWTGIIQVDAGEWHTVGLKDDGTVVAVGGKPALWVLCFIATAAYGTPMAKEVQTLREFRDEYLLTSSLGQALVDFYYKVSPPMAKFITEHPSLKPIVRTGLLPVVAMSAAAVNTTPAEKAAVIGSLVLVSVALATWAARRRRRGPNHA